MQIVINLERPSPDDVQYDYLVFPFHARTINGMDVCIKKHLVATSSIDKTIKVWHYGNQFSLEISKEFQEEGFSVAFHPSGFHLIVGFNDRIKMMNVFQNDLQPYKDIPIKQCREIVFSNGGHLFACQNQGIICIFKFYTAENPSDYVFKKHTALIRSIAWLDDDTGFISAAWDSTIYLWKLDSKVPVWEYT